MSERKMREKLEKMMVTGTTDVAVGQERPMI